MHLHRSRPSRQEACDDNGRRAPSIPRRGSSPCEETCQPACENLSKAIGTGLFSPVQVWSDSDSRLRNFNSRVTEFLRKFCPLKTFFPQAARASSPCKREKRIFRCVRFCHLLMIERPTCVYGPSEGSCDYCRVIAICR